MTTDPAGRVALKPLWMLLDDLTGEWNPPPEYKTRAEVSAWVKGVGDVIRLAKSLDAALAPASTESSK